jgi:hypothetical protein
MFRHGHAQFALAHQVEQVMQNYVRQLLEWSQLITSSTFGRTHALAIICWLRQIIQQTWTHLAVSVLIG